MIDYINTHSLDLFNILTAVIALASVIVKLTPTPKDDTVLAKVKAFVEALALNKK